MITMMAMYLNTVYHATYPIWLCFLGDIILFVLAYGASKD